MHTLQFGSLVLNLEIMIYLLCIIAGALAIGIKLRTRPERAKAVSDSLYAGGLWLLVWKGSLLLFDPTSVFENPFSLLFFSGGMRGTWLAAAVSAGFIVYRTRKSGNGMKATSERLLLMFFAWTAVFHLLQLLLSDDLSAINALAALLSVVLLAFLMLPSKDIDWNTLAAYGLWFGLGRASIPFIDLHRERLLLSFSSDQLIWLLFSIVMIIITAVLEQRRVGSI
ncbi:hypothetical protein [Paenibacillus sp. sgz302251]|uniref:hypothetical protein n=1 Tax=Paenibacillus sp. sgz302251 TaxID=3414493 RepID=UPI003C7B037E